MLSCAHVTRLRFLALCLLGVAAIWAAKAFRKPPLGAARAFDGSTAVQVCERASMRDERPERDPWRGLLPLPEIPEGTLTNDLEPWTLSELGFLEGDVVCAGWIAPADLRIRREREDAQRVQAAVAAFNQLARGCGCTAAQRLGMVADAPNCLRGRSIRECDPDPTLQQELFNAHEKMTAELADFTPVRRHWRVAGPLGRTGRFEYILEFEGAKLSIGGDAYTTSGRKPDPLVNPLVHHLMGLPDVVAVVRYDTGRALLVARELEQLLVLDYFEHTAPPEIWNGRWDELDASRPDALDELLALPELDAIERAPIGGPAVTWRVAAGVALDTQAQAARALQSPVYDLEAEIYDPGPIPFAEIRASSVAPDEAGGQPTLQIRALLSPEGHAWLDPVVAGGLAGAINPLLEDASDYTFTPAPRPPTYAFRGQAWERGIVVGARRFPLLLGALFDADANAVKGSLGAGAEIRLPQGPLPEGKQGALETLAGLAPLRTALSLRAHVLELRMEGNFLFGTLRAE